MRVALLTGSMDPHYQLDLVSGLVSAGVDVDVLGNDVMAASDIARHERVTMHNLRGDQSTDAPFGRKLRRVISYYGRLLGYSFRTRAKIFHIQWPNKFVFFDRTVLCLFYKALGKKLVFTAHNVNEGIRDGNDSWVNRLGLRVMYSLVDRVIVHTAKAKEELIAGFAVPAGKVSVIEHGLNRIVPKSTLSRRDAKRALGLADTDKALLFFGNILPYKGLEYLLDAVGELVREDDSYRVVIAGRNQLHQAYWRGKIEPRLAGGLAGKAVCRTSFIADADIELYFKAADALVLPYLSIFQSGVLFIAYAFGLPVIASDVGSFKDDIVIGKTGYICLPKDTESLAAAIGECFAGPLFTAPDESRRLIEEYAADRYSWEKIGQKTKVVYDAVAGGS